VIKKEIESYVFGSMDMKFDTLVTPTSEKHAQKGVIAAASMDGSSARRMLRVFFENTSITLSHS
jgi:hypothetical protein